MARSPAANHLLQQNILNLKMILPAEPREMVETQWRIVLRGLLVARTKVHFGILSKIARDSEVSMGRSGDLSSNRNLANHRDTTAQLSNDRDRTNPSIG